MGEGKRKGAGDLKRKNQLETLPAKNGGQAVRFLAQVRRPCASRGFTRFT